MTLSELIRIVWLNIVQNKFKVLLTSVGIIVGAATIVMVIAVGRGGQMEVADQFKNLNAGAIDISYTIDSESSSGGSSSQGGGGGGGPSGGGGSMPSGGGSMPSGGGGSMPSGGGSSGGGSSSSGSSSGGPPSMGGDSGFMIGGNMENFEDSMLNQEKITLSEDDVDDLEVFVPGIEDVTISLTTKSTVTGGELEEETSYTVAGVKTNYASMSNLSMEIGDFITESNNENKEKVCIIGYTLATEIFGSALDAYDSTIYIDERPYVINGVLSQMGTVSSGISPDDAIFVPYNTAIKYITGTDVSPTITVISSDVNNVDEVVSNIESVLGESYPNAEFTITDAGSKMEAAKSSANTLTMLLAAMATIVFIVGGIGIMNVLFVSVKERTKEIGILKAIGCSKKDILVEFLLEAAFISTLGGVLGVVVSFIVIPIVELFGIRVEASVIGDVVAVLFAILTGTLFGFYPALKASSLVPVEALSEE
ncbi:ABC transporter permease [Lachnotalea glycerini]|uniref:Macrolide ABC transporter ATP-binding protein n=1 Tax=Lachnotalea glycerini TaxID=1763509 RepID=A0A371JCW3_9FIRM|nr:ABC transporter permease [Lachnotalea glycerini]RDY30563.1 macrolide ABC transporter ATP-binding protein [Lachnotalea glycerini]